MKLVVPLMMPAIQQKGIHYYLYFSLS